MEVYSQHFKVSSLIDMPGDNLEFDVLCPESAASYCETYICWVNKLDSIYTVYLKQLSPMLGSDIVVSSGAQIKSKPRIAINRYAQGIKIAWEAYENSAWRVYLRNYYAGQLSDPIVILDSLIADPQVSLSVHRLAWTDNGNLFIKEFYPTLSGNIAIDSVNCSAPELIKYDQLQYTQILYEKHYTDSIEVNLASYDQYSNPQHEIGTLSNGLESVRPKFGMHGEIAFQTYQDGIWKSAYTISNYGNFVTTDNTDCNFRNPVLFTYPVPISLSKSSKTPFFLAFDTDSIPGNNEIFIRTFYFTIYDTTLNISQCEGNDYEPRVAYLANSDSVFISVLWKHDENGKSDIWMAKDIYDPIITDVQDGYEVNHSIGLIQNFPNPFNPKTVISYQLPVMSRISLRVYDILGREAAMLVNEVKPAGRYS